MIKILMGFLPWILYYLLSGHTHESHILALFVALAITLILDRHELKKGFVFTWGSTIFFAGLLIFTLTTSYAWPSANANFLANIALMLITWISVLIKKPFTLQYARETTGKKYWNSPLFIKVNYLVTITWGVSFIVLVLMSVLRRVLGDADGLMYEVITYLPVIGALWVTQYYPEYAKNRFVQTMIADSEAKQKDNPFLHNNFSPMRVEVDADHLKIIGQLPVDLEGIYMRNGPNPQFDPISYIFPFDGDAMVHALYFSNGRVRYRNRFVLTEQLKVERRLGKAVYGGIACPFIKDEKALLPTDPKDPIKIGRFIHIIKQADVYLALHETTTAYQLTRDLETLGEWKPKNSVIAPNVNAHSRLDPDTGDRYFISYSENPEIEYLVVDAAGNVTEQGKIATPYAYMIHDFVMTENYVVIFLSPVILNLTDNGNPIAWRPEFGTTVFVLSRNDLSKPPIEIKTEAFFTFHFANAYEDNNCIIVDHARYEKIEMDVKETPHACLYRTILDLGKNIISHVVIDKADIEFPKINESYNSKLYRYIYSACNPNIENETYFHAIVKYDMQSGTYVRHDVGLGSEVDEPVFVPKSCPKDEDDGYVMFYVYHQKTQSSELYILDALNFTAEPLAKIVMPQRVPHGLHGSWMQE